MLSGTVAISLMVLGPRHQLIPKFTDMAPHHSCGAKLNRQSEIEKCDTHKAKRKANMSTEGGKEVIRLITQDQIRKLTVRRQEPIVHPIVIDKQDLQELKKQSTVITVKDRLEQLEKEEAEKNRMMRESDARKEELRRHIKLRETGTKLAEVDLEAKKRAEHLLQRAFELRQEQEDEVKDANRVILGTKCHAIRDAQIAEKKLIRDELEREERRLDDMMEQERQRALREQRGRGESDEQRRKLYVQNILEQINEHELERLQQADRIREEAWLANKAQGLMMQQELEEQARKAEQQRKVREELRQINEQLQHFRQLEEEEERIEELKVQQYMRQKAEREAAREEELKLQRLAREREIGRLRMLQQRQQDLQAEMDNVNAQRIQDEVEREWRRKEKQAVQKRRRQEEEMKASREAQIRDRRHMQALENAALRKEHESVLKVQREELGRFRAEEEARRKGTERYRADILRQIREKERGRIEQRREVFALGEAIKAEEREHKQRTQQVVRRKVDELRMHKVPEKYVKEIEKRLHLVP
ncbi:cilia- and flagella-associated protein 45-like [Bacillus rossius redtenbacheri]|uniref:cilia- and flagella-associated protein 45-like n=1 Tax=Bacillus rossius redtenbacheri TaxID=93214 RepID=UPI002FDD44C8